MRDIWGIVAALALAALAAALPAAAATPADASLQQAARHFADGEDDKARALLETLSGEGLAEADVLLGYLYADPLYPGRDYQAAVGAFERAAAAGNAEAIFQLAESRFWPDYSGWILTPDEKAVRPTADDAFGLLQRLAEGSHNAARWRLAWLCTFGGYDCGEAATGYSCRQTPDDSPLDDCLVPGMRDHYFACSKLSLIDYLRVRYKIDYTASERYMRCRGAMISARQR